jgi:glutamine amidotransferase
MAKLEIAVVDYGAGNLRSVMRALEVVGASPVVVNSGQGVENASCIVFPGQGACDSAMGVLEAGDLAASIKLAIQAGTPFLGVCLGLQLLFDFTEEGKVPCLGVYQGEVLRIESEVKVPHMGWNDVTFSSDHPVFVSLNNTNEQYYFVHSYYVEPHEDSIIAGTTDYGSVFCSAIAVDNVVATQFHPEKSGSPGLKIYESFVKFAQTLQ